MVTPLYSKDGTRAVLVRRGWAPASWQQAGGTELLAAADQVARLDGVAVGVVTNGEKGNSFVAENNGAKGEWFTLDVAAMVRKRGACLDSRQ